MAHEEHVTTVSKMVGGKTYTFRQGEQYAMRAARQREDCTTGAGHWHNPVEDECCPCFGCCVPALIERKDAPTT